jgi:predicted helicase
MAESTPNAKRARIFYARVDEFARKEDKYRFLDDARSLSGVEWQELEPDAKHNWLTEGLMNEFETFMPLGSREAKAKKGEIIESIFKVFSNGNDSGRDDWVYNFDKDNLLKNIKVFADTYNSEVDRWHRSGKPENLDEFIINDEKQIKWTRNAKRDLRRGHYAEYSPKRVRNGLYRPFTFEYLYAGKIFNKEVALFPQILPNQFTENENRVITLPSLGGRTAFWSLCTNLIPNAALTSLDWIQCFPFYTYNEDGTNRRENITDWSLVQFREQYKDKSITKLDIFHYVYALLHHPTYRTTYAANLKRELPRIPFVKSPADFRALARAGERLADLHVNYEAQPEYPLARVEQADAALDWRVERMRLSKDKRSIVYNDFLTLEGIPPETFEYRLGNRSALEWIIDQYQVSTDRRSGITNDPNRADNPQYILKLIGKVTTVSVETVKIVRALPELQLG